MVDVFAETRRSVTAKQAAQFYGLEIDRTGRARCCFHSPDKHPSMTFKGSGFHCWSCGAHGSSIDLVAQLCGLDALGAVRKLNEDFRLNLPIDRPQPPQERAEAARAAAKRRDLNHTSAEFEVWRTGLINQLNACFREAHLALRSLETPADLDKLTSAQALALREQARFEWLADTLATGTMAEMMEIFRERGRIGQLCEKVLKPTPTRSSAA